MWAIYIVYQVSIPRGGNEITNTHIIVLNTRGVAVLELKIFLKDNVLLPRTITSDLEESRAIIVLRCDIKAISRNLVFFYFLGFGIDRIIM